MSEIHDRPTDPIEVFRFEVTLQRTVIVYAVNEDEARMKATQGLSGMSLTHISQIPPDNGHGPTVDLPPGPPVSPSIQV